MFSNNASRSMLSSAVSRTIAGMVARPAAWAARQRRSPITSWYSGTPGCAGDRPHHDRLHQSELADGVHEFGQCLLVEHLSRLARIALDRRRVDLPVHGTDGALLRRAADHDIGRGVTHPRPHRGPIGIFGARRYQRSQAAAEAAPLA